MNLGTIQYLVPFLKEKEKEILIDVLECISMICSGPTEVIDKVVDGEIPKNLVNILNSESTDNEIMILEILSKISECSAWNRDHVIDLGIEDILVNYLNQENLDIEVLKKVVRLICCIIKPSPHPYYHRIQKLLTFFSKLFSHKDIQVVNNISFALCYFSDDAENIKQILNLNLHICIVYILKNEYPLDVLLPCIRTIGNLVIRGTNKDRKEVINSGVLKYLKNLIQNGNYHLRGEILWTLSNICLQDSDTVQKLIIHDIFPSVVDIYNKEKSDIKKEAFQVLSNAVLSSNIKQISYFLSLNCLDIFKESLFNEELKNQTLLTLNLIIGHNIFHQELKDKGVFDCIQQLFDNQMKSVYDNYLFQNFLM